MEDRKIIIRDAREGDARLIAWAVLTALDLPADELDRAARICADPRTMYSWRNTRVAEVDGVPVGCLVAYPGDRYVEMRDLTWPMLWGDDSADDYPVEPEALPGEFYLDSMAILPEYRGLEIGHKLMLDGIERGRRAGSTSVTLLVSQEKPRLRDYYAALGFRPSGEMDFFGHAYNRLRLRL